MKNERQVGALRCSEVLEKLSDYLENELSAKDRADVDKHLESCTVCERFGGEMGSLLKAVRAMQRTKVPKGVGVRLRDMLQKKRETSV